LKEENVLGVGGDNDNDRHGDDGDNHTGDEGHKTTPCLQEETLSSKKKLLQKELSPRKPLQEEPVDGEMVLDNIVKERSMEEKIFEKLDRLEEQIEEDKFSQNVPNAHSPSEPAQITTQKSSQNPPQAGQSGPGHQLDVTNLNEPKEELSSPPLSPITRPRTRTSRAPQSKAGFDHDNPTKEVIKEHIGKVNGNRRSSRFLSLSSSESPMGETDEDDDDDDDDRDEEYEVINDYRKSSKKVSQNSQKSQNDKNTTSIKSKGNTKSQSDHSPILKTRVPPNTSTSSQKKATQKTPPKTPTRTTPRHRTGLLADDDGIIDDGNKTGGDEVFVAPKKQTGRRKIVVGSLERDTSEDIGVFSRRSLRNRNRDTMSDDENDNEGDEDGETGANKNNGKSVQKGGKVVEKIEPKEEYGRKVGQRVELKAEPKTGPKTTIKEDDQKVDPKNDSTVSHSIPRRSSSVRRRQLVDSDCENEIQTPKGTKKLAPSTKENPPKKIAPKKPIEPIYSLGDTSKMTLRTRGASGRTERMIRRGYLE